MTDIFESAFAESMSRRRLIQSIAAAGAATWVAGSATGRALGATADHIVKNDFAHFRAIAPSAADALEVPDGYSADVVIAWGDEFAPGMRFGYNCDYSAFYPLEGKSDEGLLWINHEYVIPFFTSDWTRSMDASWNPRTTHRAIMEREMKEVGGSIVHVKRASNGKWNVVEGSRFSRRFYGDGPPIPYDGPVAGTSLVPSSNTSLGTLANCSGCHTPWGTVLSCEENYQSYGLRRNMPFALGWIKGNGSTTEEVNYYIGEPGTNVDGQRVQDRWPFYGYVTEVDPYTGKAVKHTAMGRIHHENVALRIAKDGRVVAYSGDDAPAADGMFFKFVSTRKWRKGMSREDGMKLLSEGQLYVARWFPEANDPNVQNGHGKWVPLNMRDPEALAFTTPWIETNIVPAEKAKLSEFRVPRAEDCEIMPGAPRRVLIALTSAKGRPADKDAYGVVRLLQEDTEDPDGATFKWVDLLEGGPETGFANPDNMAFSSERELWIVTDVSSSRLNVPGRNFEFHGNNALFYVPLRGPNARTAFRFANGPVEAELTGPTFVPRQKTLFLNVQHPGEETPNKAGADPKNPQTFTSWWPSGNRTAGTGTPAKPKPSLVAITKRR
ncbi:MAG TPA: alkaline phosphatase PhoX [Gaiellaceae bacterium]|nr:alkaline phosphatase PhoX [Gaiellaceae bacterium]